MPKHGKKYQKSRAIVDRDNLFSPQEAFTLVKDLSTTKFNESIDVDINLGVDPTKSEQGVQGAVLLPHARGAVPRVIVFAKGEHAEKARDAGADFVGADDLVEKIKNGWMEFDYAVATPDVMGLVGKLAKILGPRGLLPNKKLGTVTLNTERIVSELKQGKAFFKSDKGGSVHFSLGKVSHNVESLVENFRVFLKTLMAAKPPAAKGRYLKKIVISSTMGVGIPIDTTALLANKL